MPKPIDTIHPRVSFSRSKVVLCCVVEEKYYLIVLESGPRTIENIKTSEFVEVF